MNIKWGDPNVEQLFSTPTQYVIPLYQRSYSWTSTQITELWTDLTSLKPGTEHFLGPVVLHDTQQDDVVEVIDGQQRMATLQMLLAIIRDKYVVEFKDPVRDPTAGQDTYSSSPQALIRSSGRRARHKLVLAELNRTFFETFVLRQPTDPGRKWVSSKTDIDGEVKHVRAVNKRLIDGWLQLNSLVDDRLAEAIWPSQIEALRTLEDILLEGMRFVKLELKNLDDAYLLFETLNDRGLELSAADLLKNHLLSQLAKAHPRDHKAVETAASSWDRMVEGLGGGDITGFLRHYLLMDQSRVKKSDVFDFFRKAVRTGGPDATLSDLTQSGEAYRSLTYPQNADPAQRDALLDLRGTGVATARVAALPALRWVQPNPRLLEFLRVCEVLAFRWFITNGNAQELETTFQKAAHALKTTGGKAVDDAQQTLVDKLPRDEVFRNAFVYHSPGQVYVAAYALRKIEQALVPLTGKTVKGPSEVNLEHMIPKAQSSFWLARTSGFDYDEIVGRWGNLTLLVSPVNQAIQNSEWPVKLAGTTKFPGYTTSDIVMTKDVSLLPDWTAVDVELRSRWLAVLAMRTWALKAPGFVELPTSFADVKADPTLLDSFEAPPP